MNVVPPRTCNANGFFVAVNAYPVDRQSPVTKQSAAQAVGKVLGGTRLVTGLCRCAEDAMIGQCEECGESFDYTKLKRFCSIACRNKHNAKQQKHPGEMKECPVCGKEFYVIPSYLKRGMTYCSKKCKGVATRGPHSHLWKGGLKPSLKKITPVRTTKNCPTCGGEFHPSYKRQTYCSIKCRKSSRVSTKMQRVCEICGKEFAVVPAVAKAGQGRFCSRQCYGLWCSTSRIGESNPRWNGGGHKYYGGNWHAQRKAARERDNNTCRRCGVTGAEIGKDMDVHHIKRFRSFKSHEEANNLSNLICLCPSCHTTVEHKGIDFDLPANDVTTKGAI